MSKLAVIVGVGPGIGIAVARKFGKNGFKVALLARNHDKLIQIAEELKKEGIESHPFTTDVTDENLVIKSFTDIKKTLGHISVLVYNAAMVKHDVASQLSASTLKDTFAVNTVGALVSAQQVIPEMKAAGGGTIIFTGGLFAIVPYYKFSSLTISTSGLRNLTILLSQELKSNGIHVATVTVCGRVAEGSYYDPTIIADNYWVLHTQPPDAWKDEIVFRDPSGPRYDFEK